MENKETCELAKDVHKSLTDGARRIELRLAYLENVIKAWVQKKEGGEKLQSN